MQFLFHYQSIGGCSITLSHGCQLDFDFFEEEIPTSIFNNIEEK